ncbi:Uncharacterised protein [Neisseria animaloris]|uniref:Uncharacterized protein n=1 Tax=Neisseria animaloris TaxID=326522 RepID=A0A448U9F7_9NEIS|nr:hypothetical protein [Neisseria animaloris]MDO5073223.1 hypothetical protein [Neisseria animaloris]VEH87333.1 Uncharacterised protein [Neisseria animaloris]VEJ20523.1 Uncharacterised protein [Neisseria animaloris]
MIDRLMPIFAVIGVLSTIGYIGLTAWVMYDNFNKSKKKTLPGSHR